MTLRDCREPENTYVAHRVHYLLSDMQRHPVYCSGLPILTDPMRETASASLQEILGRLKGLPCANLPQNNYYSTAAAFSDLSLVIQMWSVIQRSQFFDVSSIFGLCSPYKTRNRGSTDV